MLTHWIACTLAGIACLLASSAWAQEGQRTKLVADEILASSDWKEYTQLLAENYVGAIDAQNLEQHCRKSIAPDAQEADAGATEDCLRGAVDSLAYFPTYMSIDETTQLDAQARQVFVGIGIEITQRDGWVQIVKPIPGGPAERAGLMPGDLILSLNGRSTRRLPLADAVRLMRGEAGTELRLEVARPDITTLLTFAVKREAIRALTVRSRWVAPGLAYIRVSQFRDETRNELISAVQELPSDGARSMKGLVLDLRSCPGGLLTATVDIASLFVRSGASVLRTEGRKAGVSQVYVAGATPNVPRKVQPTTEPPDWSLRVMRVVVLVDRGTGGGAEAVAALLREVRGATVVGEKSFGFGVVEQVFRLQSGASIRIATALMSTPSGRAWTGPGIDPDVVVKRAEGPMWEFGDLQFDADLKAAVDALQR